MSVQQKITEYLAENFLLGDASELNPDESLLDSGVMDSTGVMELVQFLEQTFRIEVQDDDLVPENLDTIANIDAFVNRKLAAQTEKPTGTG